MFHWLSNLLRKRRERGREIFRFWDGARERGADPISVMRAIALDEVFVPEVHLDPLLLEGIPNRDAAEASQIAVEAARRIFGVQAWSDDQPGLTEQETLQLWLNFAEYLDGLKKNSSPNQTGPEVTETAPTVSEDESGTNTTSDSTSTLDESRPAELVAS